VKGRIYPLWGRRSSYDHNQTRKAVKRKSREYKNMGNIGYMYGYVAFSVFCIGAIIGYGIGYMVGKGV
jgi:hypothetical protein